MAKEPNQEQAPTPAPAPVSDAPEALGPPKSYRLQIIIGIAGILLFQTIVLFMLSPRQPPPQYRGGIDPTNGPRIFGEGTEPASVMPTVPMIEKSLKESPFKIKAPSRDDTDSSETFSLVMHVKIRKKDEYKFENRYNECKNEVIDRVSRVLQEATHKQRQEPGFTTIKAKAREAINTVLRIPYVQEVMASDSSYDVT